jgi:hypothetical protein
MLTLGISISASRISSSISGVHRSWFPLAGNTGAKFPCPQRWQWNPMILVDHCWQHQVQNSHIHKGGDGYLQTFSYLGIFILVTFLGRKDESPQHYSSPNCTWNAYWIALDFSTLSHQLAITTHLTHNYCTLLPLRFGNFTDTVNCLNVVNDGYHLLKLQNPLYHSGVSESLTRNVHVNTWPAYIWVTGSYTMYCLGTVYITIPQTWLQIWIINVSYHKRAQYYFHCFHHIYYFAQLCS